jgi:hypothetical protein
VVQVVEEHQLQDQELVQWVVQEQAHKEIMVDKVVILRLIMDLQAVVVLVLLVVMEEVIMQVQEEMVIKIQ